MSMVTFQFTHPVWGATWGKLISQINQMSFNSRTPCGVRHKRSSWMFRNTVVSIHAPRAGCDRFKLLGLQLLSRFNSRTPCGVRHGSAVTIHEVRICFNSRTPCGVRRITSISNICIRLFQFTHPVRGATLECQYHLLTRTFQFTHPVRGATP